MFTLDDAQPQMSSEDIGIGRKSYRRDFRRRYMVAPVHGHTRWQCNNLIDASTNGVDGEGLGDLGFMKKLRKIAKKPLDLHHKGLMKITPKPLRKKLDKAYKKTMGTVDKVLDKLDEKVMPILVPVAGAVLAPFTGGASLAAAAAISYGLKRDAMKTAKKKAKDEEKKEQAKAAARYRADEAAYLKAQAEQGARLQQAGGTVQYQDGRGLWSAVPQQMDQRALSFYQQGAANLRTGGVFIPPKTFRNSVTNIPQSSDRFFPEREPQQFEIIATDEDKKTLAIGAAVVAGGLMLLA